MADKKMYKVGITVKEPWSADISYEVLDITLYAVENGGDGCSYIAIRANQGVTPGTDDTVWVKATQRGQSIYDLAVKYGDFEGTEAEFEAEYEAALHAAQSAAQSASEIEAQVETNEAARVTAERARSDAETARSSAETARINAENARNDAEGLRDTAESDRVRAEAGRVTAEASRVEAETFRQGAEQSRRQQFEGLKADMETAIENVDAKSAEIAEDIEGYEANEAARVSAEQSRVSAESSRVSAESARATAETERQTAEGNRATAETERASAEGARTTAEQGRVSAESGRVSAESERVAAETARESASATAVSNAEAAAQAANTAAEHAEEAATTIDEKIEQKADESEVIQLRAEVTELDYTTTDADVHQVNTDSTVETTSGTRLRLLFYVSPGAIVSASCPLGSGLAAGVYSTKDYAVIAAADTGLLQSLSNVYVHSLQNAVISAKGYLSISLKKSDGSSFSAQEKEQYLAQTIISITKDSLAQNVDELGQEVTIINSSIGEVPPALMSKDLEYSKLSETFWNAYSADNTSLANLRHSPFIIKNIKIGVITSLTAKFASIGKITIGKIKVVDVIEGQAFDYTKILGRKSYNIPTTGEQTIQIEPLYIADDEYIAIGMPSDSADFYFGSSGGTMRGYYYVGSNGILTKEPASGRYLGVKVDGYKYTTIPCTMVENGFFASDTLMSIVGRERVTRLFYNGYSAINNARSIPANSPFPIKKDYDTDYYVNSIKLGIASPGNLTIGKIKKVDAMPGAIADRSKVFDKIVLTFEEVGEYTCKLPSSWDSKIKMDEYLVLQDIGDTAMFYYGDTTPRDRGFLYIPPSTGAWAATGSSLNVDINVDIIYQDSSYTGKKISILGDSISTFAGYIPEGNATYYPTGTVQSVEDTWWKKLINALGLELDINNSWSGSRVTTTAGETSAGCMSRCQNLGDPDVIIIWMGINDFNNEVALGTYDGKSAVPSNTTTFREAYAIMLDKVLAAYPRAEIWACTLPQCERNGTTGFPEINGNGISLLDFNIAIEELARAFGVKVLDHNRCGLTYQNMSVYNPDNLHPNKYGHSLIANNDIRQMDNVIRWRFPIA